MIPISAALETHIQSEVSTLATLWKVTLVGGSQFGFTDHDIDITYQGLTYRAATGFTRSDVAGSNDLSVDNLEAEGVLVSPAITEEDLRAGRWDFAAVEIMRVNWADLTMGPMILRVGRLGQVSIGRGSYRAEVRGLTQAYSRTIGELTQPGCRAELYDNRCQVDPHPFTVSGTVDSVSSDGLTVFDSDRDEPGPAGGVNITNVTNADPGQVTVDDAADLLNNMTIMIDGVVGPEEINTMTVIRNLSGNTFDLPIDTSDLGPYVSGGTVTPLGREFGYFDFGVITFNSGLNAGLSMEIRNYVPGQWTLALPMPYPIAVGDSYTMKAGCDKSFTTCKDRFDNVINFRGEPYLPGRDKLFQVVKQAKSTD